MGSCFGRVGVYIFDKPIQMLRERVAPVFEPLAANIHGCGDNREVKCELTSQAQPIGFLRQAADKDI
jgi:hypothetical protein